MRRSFTLTSVLLGLVSFTQPATAERPTLGIELVFPSAEGGALEIELTYGGLASGETIVEVTEDWGGSIFQEGIIENVRVVRGTEMTEAPVAEAPFAWRAETGRDGADTAPLRVRYALPQNDHIRGLDGDRYYKPIVTDGLVHLIGQQSLLLPRAWEDEASLDVTLRWSGLSDGISAMTSFGIDAGPHRFETTKEELRQGLYVAGRGKFLRGDGEDPVHVFIADGPWRFEAKEFADMAQSIVAAEREFFGEKEAGAFLITAIAIGPETAEHLSYGGTGLTDAFATFFVPVLKLDEEGRKDVQYLLAHEKAHTWIGGMVATREEPETAGYWFSEGTTDYYTPRMLYRAGLMTPRQVIEQWNGYLRRYFLSPASKASNQEVADGFWNDRYLQRLAYMRGASVIFFLDQIIRKRTGGEVRFDEALFHQIELAREQDRWRELTNDEWRSALEAHWKKEELDSAFGTLIDGRLLELPEDLLAPCAKLSWHEQTTFQLGLQIDESTGKVLSVEEHSNAYLAGLRAGQQLGGWSISYGQPGTEVVLQSREEEEPQELRFLPAGPKRMVPRFDVVDEAACVDPM